MLKDVLQEFNITPRGRVYPADNYLQDTAMLAVSEFAGALYSSDGASDDEIIYGCEYFFENSRDFIIKSNALSMIIHIKTKRLINKQL